MVEQDPQELSVWPGFAPGEITSSPGHDEDDHSNDVTRRTGVTSPRLYVYGFDDGQVRPAVIVCPGGGYYILATDLEGVEIARWLNSLGFVSAVLHYRVPENRDGALADAQRSVSLLRSRSSEFGIDPNRIGALGFSAGGHLTARLAVTGDDRAYQPVDSVDKISCAPNFALLIYPAYLVDKTTGDVTPNVSPNCHTPPIFLAQTEDDEHYCTTAYSKYLAASGVEFSNNIYATGGHGYGIRASNDIPVSQWPIDAAKWLADIEDR